MAQPQWKRLRTDNMKQESSEEVYHEQPSEEEEITQAEIVQKQLQRRAARQLLRLILEESRKSHLQNNMMPKNFDKASS